VSLGRLAEKEVRWGRWERMVLSQEWGVELVGE
jgi:hypothetical protein